MAEGELPSPASVRRFVAPPFTANPRADDHTVPGLVDLGP